MSTDPDRTRPADPELTDAEDRDPEVSDGEAPQAMRLFSAPTEPDVHLDPDNPAFDRVQEDKAIDETYERDYNADYVKEHGDKMGHQPTTGPEADKRRASDS